MLINKINIEGLYAEEKIKDISLKECKIYNCDVNFTLYSSCGIKDIIQISINTEITHIKSIDFKNNILAILTVETNFSILATENKESNSLSFLEESNYFNYSFESPKKIDNSIKIDIIDCYFKLVNNHQIVGTLTYIFRDTSLNANINENISDGEICYKLIDINQEFA